MQFDWPADTRTQFGQGIVEARHDLAEDARLSDDGLAALLDSYPRGQLGIYRFPEHGEGRLLPEHGLAEGVAGRDILDAVRRGRIWLNLRAAGDHGAGFGDLRDGLFDSLDAAAGVRTLKRDLGVLISSPGVNVQYHLDIPLVVLVQVRGRKRVWLYPPGAEFAADEHIEAIALREQEEDLPFEAGFDADATVIDLEPGMAITWPQTAPHRVKNHDMLNVSLSCEFMTLPALIHANAIHMNGVLRRRMGLKPRRSSALGPGVFAKAALARAFKALDRTEPPPVRNVTFRIDPDAETGVASV